MGQSVHLFHGVQMVSNFISVPPPFGFVPTVQSHGWWELQPFSWDRDQRVLHLGLRLPGDRIAAVRLKDAVERCGMFWEADESLTPAQQESAVWHIRSVFRLDENLSHFYRLCWRQECYKDLVLMGAGRILRAPTLFENLVKGICGTNIQWKQAVACINRVADLGDPVPDSALRLFPTPEQILKAGEGYLKETARLGYRAKAVRELSEMALHPDFRGPLVEQGRLRGEDLREFFLSIPGIGPVTAHYLLVMYGEYGYLPVDSSVVDLVQKKYCKGVKPTQERIEEIYQPYGKYKALVVWYELARYREWF